MDLHHPCTPVITVCNGCMQLRMSIQSPGCFKSAKSPSIPGTDANIMLGRCKVLCFLKLASG